MLFSVKRGATGIILRCKILNSSLTTGGGLTGLTSASSGLIISTVADNESTATAYTVAGSTIESITTLGTYATPTATKCRFKEVDSTNHKGVYEVQLADARLAVSSAKSMLVSISGATNAAECDFLIPLQDLDPYDSVRAGLTALPNAAAAASGGLLVAGTGTNAINPSGGKVPATLASTDVTGNVAANVLAWGLSGISTNITGNLSGSVGSVTGNVGGSVASVTAGVTVADKTGFSLTQAFPTNFSSLSINASGHVSRVVLADTVTTYTGNTPQTGDSFARIGVAGAGLTAVTGVTLAASQHVIVDSGTVTTLTNLPTAPTDWLTAAAVKADAVTKIQAGLATPTNITAATGITVATNSDKTGYSLSVTPPTASTIAGAVWDLATSGHTTSGTFGAAMNAAGAAGDPWSTTVPGAYGAGTAGYILGNNLDAKVSTASAPSAATVATAVWAAVTRTLTAGTNIVLAKGTGVTGFNDIAAASVWAVARTGNQTAGSFGEYVDAAVSTRSTYAGVDTSGTTTLLSRLTSTRAGNLDNLDAAITTRLATGNITVGGYATGQDPATLTWAAGTRTITGGTITTYAGNTPQTGDAYARLGAAGAGLTALGDARLANLDAAISTRSTFAGGAVASVTAPVAVSDKTGFSLATAPPTAAEVADKLLGRNVAGGSDGGRTVSEALYALRNKVDIATGHVYGTDDTTIAWSFAVTTDAAAEPITGIDPT